MPDDVRLETRGNVAILTLDAPARRNALTPAMAEMLIEHCEQIDTDIRIGATIIQGSESAFCAGGDLQTLADIGNDPTEDDAYRKLESVYRAFGRVGRLKMPTIAAVRGVAVGAGVNLLLSTNLRIVAKSARIVAGFGRIGLHPGGGHFALLSRLVGQEAAAAIGMFGEALTGEQAEQIGLAWESVPDDQVEQRAEEIGARVAEDPELSRSVAKTFKTELGPPPLSLEAALEIERGVQMWSLRRSSQFGDRG